LKLSDLRWLPYFGAQSLERMFAVKHQPEQAAAVCARAAAVFILTLFISAGLAPVASGEHSRAAVPEVSIEQLPPQARATLSRIENGGPFPYSRDGTIFNNFEGRLPKHPRGYYREYTVPTPGSTDRGARRIVVGKNREFYYTEDHYRTFRRIRE
jgi:ribonuclease T1